MIVLKPKTAKKLQTNNIQMMKICAWLIEGSCQGDKNAVTDGKDVSPHTPKTHLHHLSIKFKAQPKPKLLCLSAGI